MFSRMLFGDLVSPVFSEAFQEESFLRSKAPAGFFESAESSLDLSRGFECFRRYFD